MKRMIKEGVPTITFREAPLDETVLAQLIRLSRDWAAENICYGYTANKREDIDGNRIFLAEEGGEIVGYLFGHAERAKTTTSVMPEGTVCFEVEELYVVPARRSRGVGGALFRFAEDAVRAEAEYIVLGTATKNWRAILHFYLEELGMEFWSARLFKPLRSGE